MALSKLNLYIINIVLPLAIGSLSGLLTMDSMDFYRQMVQKPPLAPPAWIFPAVWTILYVLMGISSAIIWQTPSGKERDRGLNLYYAQLIVNFFWSLIFFNGQAFGFAAIWLILLWILVALMILQFRKVHKLAAALQIPYLIWLTFAAYLNIWIWAVNR